MSNIITLGLLSLYLCYSIIFLYSVFKYRTFEKITSSNFVHFPGQTTLLPRHAAFSWDANDYPVTSNRIGTEDQAYKCKNCPRSYKYKENLYRHLRLECGIQSKFLCHMCPYKAKQKSTLQRHVRSMHTDKNVLQALLTRIEEGQLQ